MSENSWVIWDKELENLLEDWQDKLWTTKHVNQLFKIITDLSADELEKWFNIGLYWWWWSGKSSITNALKKRINSERGNEFWVIDFDCWKYSNDDLRRSILFEISKLYKDSNLTEKLEQVFYFDKSKSKETEEINKDLLKKICIIGVPLLIGFWMIKWLWEDSSILEAVCWSGIILLLIKSIIELISKWTLISKLKKILSKIDITSINNLNIKDFIPTVKISRTISEEKIFSWEQFESLFKILIWREVEGYNQFGEIKEIIKKAKLLKDKKVLLIFDNIDRCESASVKEILMTIKTFLNQDNCIFLLPIDYENVCKSYESYDQWDEYLRKIFNLWINLKQPHYSKLSDLVMDLMETNLRKDEKWLNITDDESSTIAYILASAFADNPRKIKQFLNQLWAEYILYEKIEQFYLYWKNLYLD